MNHAYARPEMTDVIKLQIKLSRVKHYVPLERYSKINGLLCKAFEHSDSCGFLNDKGVEFFDEARIEMGVV